MGHGVVGGEEAHEGVARHAQTAGAGLRYNPRHLIAALQQADFAEKTAAADDCEPPSVRHDLRFPLEDREEAFTENALLENALFLHVVPDPRKRGAPSHGRAMPRSTEQDALEKRRHPDQLGAGRLRQTGEHLGLPGRTLGRESWDGRAEAVDAIRLPRISQIVQAHQLAFGVEIYSYPGYFTLMKADPTKISVRPKGEATSSRFCPTGSARQGEYFTPQGVQYSG